MKNVFLSLLWSLSTIFLIAAVEGGHVPTIFVCLLAEAAVTILCKKFVKFE